VFSAGVAGWYCVVIMLIGNEVRAIRPTVLGHTGSWDYVNGWWDHVRVSWDQVWANLRPTILQGGMMLVTLTGASCGVGLIWIVGTLRAGTLVAGLFCAGGALGLMVPCRMVMSCWRAALWLLLSGANGELADGLCNVVVTSAIPTSSRSREDVMGMGTFVGNHVSVSHIHCAHVSVIHTV